MTDFADDYKTGDIIYGRFDQTIDYWGYLLKKRNDIFHEFMKSEALKANCPKAIKNFKLEHDSTFDQLDEKLKKHASDSQTQFLIGYFHKGFTLDPSAKIDIKSDTNLNLENMLKSDDRIPERYNTSRYTYHSELYNSRYSPFSCLQINHETGAAGVGKVSNYDEYLRRACKFGVLNIKSIIASATIRFVLDEIEMNDVISKKKFLSKKEEIVPITTSELRALFRNWNHAKGHVVFYRKMNSVVAPWEQNPGDWLEYSKLRYRKYYDLLVTLKHPPQQNLNNGCNDATLIYDAADALKTQAIEYMKTAQGI